MSVILLLNLRDSNPHICDHNIRFINIQKLYSHKLISPLTSKNSWPGVQRTQCYSTWPQTRQQNVGLFSAKNLHEGPRVLLDFSLLLYKEDTNQTNHA